MDILVLGIDHCIQEIDYHDHLKNILLDHLRKSPVDLIAEEWSQGSKKDCSTVASRLALSIGAERHNMEMPDDLMNEKGVLQAIKQRRANCSSAYLDHEDQIRECHWLSEIQACAPKKGVIALCGMIHVERFSKKLEEAGFAVITKTLKEFQWYNDWQERKKRDYNQAVRERDT